MNHATKTVVRTTDSQLGEWLLVCRKYRDEYQYSQDWVQVPPKENVYCDSLYTLIC